MALARIRRALALEPTVAAVAIAVLVMSFGQELWAGFLPEYLRVLGASALVVGLFGTCEDLLDAAYAYPGGVISDRIGSGRSLLLFGGLTAAGLAVYLVSRSVATVFVGLTLAAAWRSLGLPATFSAVGRHLAGRERVIAFSVQAVVKRLPVVLAPPLGGLLLTRRGVASGTHAALAVSIVLAIATLLALSGRLHRSASPSARPLPSQATSEQAGRRLLHRALRQLLVSDCLVRFCEGLPDVFLVVWALEKIGVTPVQFGVLQSVKTLASILSYLPAAALSARFQRKALVVVTFLFFALFPIAVVASRSMGHLAAAYVVGGLRELGEPSRKALILDLADRTAPGRSVGLYYAIRGFTVAGAAVVGGVLWSIRPELTFLAAAILGGLGVAWAILFLPAAPVWRPA